MYLSSAEPNNESSFVSETLQLLETEIEAKFLIVTQVVNERSPSLLITVEARRTGNRRNPPKMIALKLKLNKGLNCNQDNPLISPEFPINMEVISVTLLLLKRLLIYTTYWILITDIYYILNIMEIIKNHMKYNDRVVFVREGFCPGGIMSGFFFVWVVFVRVVFVRFFFCPYTDKIKINIFQKAK